MKNLITLILLLVIVACKAGNPTTSPSVRELAFPKAENYTNLVYDTDLGLTVFLYGGDQGDLQSFARENDAKFTNFRFPEDSLCGFEKYSAGDVSANGQLEIWEWCLTSNGGVQYIRMYDWSTKRLARLAGPLPLGSSSISWNPDRTQGIVYLDSRFATKTLYWLFQDGSFSPLDLVIADGSRSWNLKDDFPDFKADDTGKTGSTGRAEWSPDGKSIAFFASPDAVGRMGFNRFGVEYYLYLMNPETLELTVVAKEIYSPFLIQWSPDSAYIAFIGGHGFWKERGLWLYSVKDNSVTSISAGIFQALAWTSREKLAAIECEDFEICRNVLEYDLTDVVRP